MSSSKSNNRVCVIGAGLIGCATAYELSQAGYKVHLIDADAEAGMGTSFANGAQLSYSYVEPFASPSTLRALPSYIFSKDSPIRFVPSTNLNQWNWLVRFLLSCTDQRAKNGTRELLALAHASRRKLEAWQARENWSFDHQQNGKLVLCPDEASLALQSKQVAFQASMGCQQKALTPEQCIAIEPALQAYKQSFAGGIWTADECVGDPYKLCQELVRCLLRDEVMVQFNTRVTSFIQKSNNAVAVLTDKGDVHADYFVVATGVQTPVFAAQLGISTPIYPIKGYSITLPIKNKQRAPKVSVTDLGRKTVFAPLNGQLRVAAKAEITGYDMNIRKQCITSMIDAVEAIFPDVCDTPKLPPWSGLRPATPDSVPLIGQTKLSNVYINSGHGALGFTLSFGSAERIAKLIARS